LHLHLAEAYHRVAAVLLESIIMELLWMCSSLQL